MSALLIYDHAPLGSIISYSDGTPQPPGRHSKAFVDWKVRNNVGRLSRKDAARRIANWNHPDAITLDWCRYSDGAVVILPYSQTFWVTSELKFTVLERPAVGSILVLDRSGENIRRVHVAASQDDASAWLERKENYSPHRVAVLREVTADDVAADVVEGRMPA